MTTSRPSRRPALWHGLLAALVILGIAGAGPLTSLARTHRTAQASYVLKTVTTADGTSVVPRWNPCQRAITYRVNLDGVAPARRPAVLGEIRTAVTRLGAVDGLPYRYAGTTRFVPRTENLADAPAEIVIAAVGAAATDLDMAESSIGFGGVMWATWSAPSRAAAVVRGYVVLNPSGFLALEPGFGAGATQGNAVLHELGHATGLEHVRSTAELMNPVLTSSAPAGYGPGDREALARVGRDAGCLSVPARVGVADLS